MKAIRFICLLLAFLMLASVVSCSNVPNNVVDSNTTDAADENTDTPSSDVPSSNVPASDAPATDTPETNSPETNALETDAPVTDAPVTDAPKPEEPVQTKVFQTGYARAAITPSVPIGDYTKIENDIYATCLAVYDGEKTLLLLSIDQKSMSESECDGIRARIKTTTKVPLENIFISATHNHSTPTFGVDSKWSIKATTKIAQVAKDAIADLSATEMFIGTGKTTGMAFVRRYINRDGTMKSVSPAYNSVRCVSEADDTLQVVRFVRKDKKDIVATNWQAHLAHAIDAVPATISSDMAHYMREDIEGGDKDALLIYFAGASGNINLNAPNAAARKYNNYVEVAHAFSKVALEVMKAENLTKIESGEIKIQKEVFTVDQKQDSPAEVAAAQARMNSGNYSAGDRYMVARNKAKTRDLRIAAVSIGELALITVPYEMFDNNGVQVKEASPFKMTLVLTNADGDYAYMPSYEACTEYFGYETEATYFGTGTAEKVVAEYIKMLNKLKETK